MNPWITIPQWISPNQPGKLIQPKKKIKLAMLAIIIPQSIESCNKVGTSNNVDAAKNTVYRINGMKRLPYALTGNLVSQLPQHAMESGNSSPCKLLA